MARGGLRGSEGARGGGESNDHRSRSWNGPDGVILGGVCNIYSWVEDTTDWHVTSGGLMGSEGARRGGRSNDHWSRSMNGPDGVILGGV